MMAGVLMLACVAVWALVDLILILTGKFTDGEGAWVKAIGFRHEDQESEPKPAPRADRPPRLPAAKPAAPTDRLQQRILMAAKQSGGAIAPTTVAMRTGFDVDAVKDHLEALVDKGHAELQPTKDGAIVYVFRDMLTDERREELELL